MHLELMTSLMTSLTTSLMTSLIRCSSSRDWNGTLCGSSSTRVWRTRTRPTPSRSTSTFYTLMPSTMPPPRASRPSNAPYRAPPRS